HEPRRFRKRAPEAVRQLVRGDDRRGHVLLLHRAGQRRLLGQIDPQRAASVRDHLLHGGGRRPALRHQRAARRRRELGVAYAGGGATSTGSSGMVVDAVSFGTITDSLAALQLPPVPAGISDGTSVERKACYNSTADASSTGLFPGGGQAGDGNSERIGAGNADWVVRPSPEPQNSAATAETRSCS